MKSYLAHLVTQRCVKLQEDVQYLWWDDKPEGMGTAQARWNNRPQFERLAERLHAYSTALVKMDAMEASDLLDVADLRDPEHGYEKLQLMQARIGAIPWREPLEALDRSMRDPEAVISKSSDATPTG